MKKCSKCGLVKTPPEFSLRAFPRRGLNAACKDCLNKAAIAKRAGAPAKPRKLLEAQWSPAEMSRLLELHGQGFSPNQIGTIMQIKGRRAQRKLFELKLLKPKKVWSDTDDQIIRQYYAAPKTGPFDLAALAKALGKTKTMVSRRAGELGVSDQTNANLFKENKRSASGRRQDLGDMFFRSAWEANYARYLNLLKAQGRIRDWDFEKQRWMFEGVKRGHRSYLCDFRIFNLDGSIEYHEVKGWMSPESKTVLTRMAQYYPDVRIVIIDKNAYSAIDIAFSASIQGWERYVRPSRAKGTNQG